MKAEGYKLIHTSFFLIHFVVVLLGLASYFIYCFFSNYDSERIAVLFFQVMTLIYPILAAWVTNIIVELEIEANGGFYLLTEKNRKIFLVEIFIYLIVTGLVSCLVIGIGVGSVGRTLVVWECSLILYAIHCFLALQVSSNINFLCAVVEILVAALMLTGLGEGIWFIFPSAWGSRIIILLRTNDISIGILLGIILVTALIYLVLLCWIDRYEGRKVEE
jgi:hypothetical protein